MKQSISMITWVIMICTMGLGGCQNKNPQQKNSRDIEVPPNVLATVEEDASMEMIDMKLWPIDTSITYVTGQFDQSKDTVFTLIDPSRADRSGMYLRKDAYKAFLAMDSAARKEGIYLQIRSATRNFDYQKSIWERKWTGETTIENGEDLSKTTPEPVERALKILRYSSMPGTSRHHWGTDIDLNNFTNKFFEHGEGLILYEWLQENASKYGYRQPYTAKGMERPYGYNEEKWHWSFFPVSDVLTSFAAKNLKNNMIDGFLGSETAEEIDVVDKYVLGLNPELLPEKIK